MSSGEVTLRSVERSDLAFTRRTRMDPDVGTLTLGRRFPITEVGELHWFEGLGSGAFPSEATFIVASGPDRTAVGLVAVNDIDWINRTAWFGIWIAPDHQGQGAGRRATELMLDYARDRLELRRVKLLVLADHEAAQALYRSVGFREEGRLVGEVLLAGVPRDLVLMACAFD